MSDRESIEEGIARGGDHVSHRTDIPCSADDNDVCDASEHYERAPQQGDTVSVKLDDENGSLVVGTYERAWQDGMVRIKGEDFELYVKTDADIRVLPKPRPPEPCRPILIGEADSPEYDELWVPEYGVSPFEQAYQYNPRNGETIERDTWANLWARTQGRSRIRIYAAVEERRFVRGEEIT